MGRGSWTTAAILAAAGIATELNQTTIAYPHAMCTPPLDAGCGAERRERRKTGLRTGYVMHGGVKHTHTYPHTHTHVSDHDGVLAHMKYGPHAFRI